MTLLVTAHVYLCYGVNCQSMWTISFVLRPSHHSLFDYWTGNNDIITHYHLPQQILPMASHQGLLMLALTVVLLALPSLTCGVTLHVRPTSTNTSCSTHPCQTISEYAQDPDQYFNDSNLMHSNVLERYSHS